MTFFFGEHLRLCPWSLALDSSISVLGLEIARPWKGCPWPWPRIFFCGLGLEPCVLDFIFALNRGIEISSAKHDYTSGILGLCWKSIYDIRAQTKVRRQKCAGHKGADIKAQGHNGARTQGRRDIRAQRCKSSICANFFMLWKILCSQRNELTNDEYFI